MNNLLPLPVLLPLLGAGLALVLGRHPNAQRIVSTTVLLIVVAVAGVPDLPHRPARPDRALGRGLAAAARHRPGRRPAVGADADGVLARHPDGADLLHGPGCGGAEAGDPGLDLPPDLPGAVGRRLQRLPGRRSVQPVRRVRDPAVRLVRAAHPRRHRRADPGRHDLRGGQRAVLAAVPDRDRGDLRGHRHGQPRPAVGAPAGAAARRPAGPAAAAAHRVLDQGRGLPAVGLAARLLPDRAGAGHRRVRRLADQGRRVRDHPHPDAAVPGRPRCPIC